MDYSTIDNSPLVDYLFHPRDSFVTPPENAFDMMVTVDEGAFVHCRFYQSEGEYNPWILYFHGNGEVVSDYNDIAPYYVNEKINLVVADYRGYGSSTGKPNFSHTVNDAPLILEAVEKKLQEKDPNNAGLWVMGRSLGSMPALTLAEKYQENLRGLIIESGFVSIVKLIKHLGLPAPNELSDIEEKAKEKVKSIELPALIIHGEMDQIVPLEQGEELYELLGGENKRIFTVPRAGHNDIFFIETEGYMNEIRKFVKREK